MKNEIYQGIPALLIAREKKKIKARQVTTHSHDAVPVKYFNPFKKIGHWDFKDIKASGCWEFPIMKGPGCISSDGGGQNDGSVR